MVELEINNSLSQVRGLTSTPFTKLRKILSYNTDRSAAFFAGGRYPSVRYVIDNKGNFNTGFLSIVTKFLAEQKIPYKPTDNRKLPTEHVDHGVDFKDLIPHNFQLDAMEFIAKEHRGIVSAPTGSGKSVVIALIVARLRVRTLIVVPSLQIKEQLITVLKSFMSDMSNITVENIDSGKLKTAKDYHCLIIDEAHHVAAKTYQRLNKSAWGNIYYRAFLTATPFRNQTEETLLFEGIAGKNLYRLSYNTAVQNKYIVPLEAYYIDVPKTSTDAYTWAEVYSTLVISNTMRNTAVCVLILRLQALGKATLCLVKEIRHGELLSKETGIPFANGQDDTTRQYIDRFNKGEIPVLIGTEGIIGEGVDTKPCEYVVIAGLGKAKSAFMQKCGRGLRVYPGKESCKIFLFRDNSHKFLLRHYREQVKVLKEEYNVIPTRLEIK